MTEKVRRKDEILKIKVFHLDRKFVTIRNMVDDKGHVIRAHSKR